MALVLPHSIFFHVGRTAGHCVRKTIRAMGISTYDVGAYHDWPSNIPLSEEERNKLFFCFVRHPLAWLKSFWCHEMQFGWSTSAYASKTQSDSFAEFLAKAVEAFPTGPATEAFRPFIMQCHEVGRQETLAEDLRRILERAGERILPNVLDHMGVTTVEIDPAIRDAATASKALLEKVMHMERELCERFGYSDIPTAMIGPANTCLATYLPLGASKQPFVADAATVRDVENAFSLDGTPIPGPEYRRRLTMAIRNAFETIDFQGKDVIDVGCADGVRCFYAESRGATRVVGTDPRLRRTIGRLKESMGSTAEFVETGTYGVDQLVRGTFDIVMCVRWMEIARYPMLLIRTLSRLMKEGGKLILQCEYLDSYPGVPLLYVPLGSEAPTNPWACTYFNREGLLNALATYGFHDFVIDSVLEQGVHAARDFARMPFATSGVRHDSESAVGVVTLSCTWSPAAADKDPRYAVDGVSGRSLVDHWDKLLPASGLPEHRATEQMLVHLRGDVNMQTQQVGILKEELRTLRAAVHDRDKHLEDARRDLVERTADLVETRRVLVERTAMLEQMVAEVQALSQELAAAKNR